MVKESGAERKSSNHLMRWRNISQTEHKILTFSGLTKLSS